MLQRQPSLRQTPGRSLAHAQVLMARASITPHDAGCQAYLIHRLNKLGFECEQFRLSGVTNLIAKWGRGNRHFAFAGHTDVVPPGPLEYWHSDPFCPLIDSNRLIGRGAADMKTGIAAMLAACERVLPLYPADKHTIWWLITSDEEGEAEYGTKAIKQRLDAQSIQLDMCLVGEPTASHYTGDTIKVGRRGSLSGSILVTGKQGHVAYPHSCDNALHQVGRIIQVLTTTKFDAGSEDFPGTSLQVTHVDSGRFTDNLVPGKAVIQFNVRYSHAFDEMSLKALLKARIEGEVSTAVVEWLRPCEAYVSRPRDNHCLIHTAEQAIHRATGRYPVLSTSGGTSDGRFLASAQTQVIELGVPNTHIHQANEAIYLSDLFTLEDIYTDILHQRLNSH